MVNKPQLREWDWFSAWVLFIMLQLVTARLVTTNWAPFLYYTETLAGLGTILGLALGASRFSGRTVAIVAGIYTLFVVPWQLSGTATNDLLLDRLSHLGSILLISLGQFLHRQPVKDSLFFVSLVCLAFWLIGLLSGYWFARLGRILGAILLTGGALITIQVYANYQSRGSWWLAVYLLMALILVGRAYFLESKKDWARRRVFVNDEAWPTILGSLVVTVGLTILAAWVVPVSAAGMNTAQDWWNTFSRPMRERLSNAVTSLNGPYGVPGMNFYGSTLGLGRSAAKGDATVFTVNVKQGAESVTRFYWQGRVYDQYADGQWSTLPATSVKFSPAGGALAIPDAAGRSEARLQFTSQFSTQSLLYGPVQPVWVDRAAVLLADQPQEGQYDVFAWDADTPVPAGGVYQVTAEVTDPNVQQLEVAPSVYPQWITDRYLQVPVDLKASFRALAQEIAGGENNPYDKAAAITDYLRANIKYSDNVPQPPEGRDPIGWVVFNYKQGFCNYYASAEVLLLRSAGVPARLAVGFAQGQLQNGVYVVRRRDAHAWPEVYFPGYGWIEFEPTVSQAALVRPDLTPTTGGGVTSPGLLRPREGEEGAGPNITENGGTPTALPFRATLAARLLFMVAIFGAAAGLVYLLLRIRIWVQAPVFVAKSLQRGGISTPRWIEGWIRWNQLEPVERSFASVNWSLRFLDRPQPTDATPAQRASELSRLVPAAARNIEALKTEFENGLFTPKPADLAKARRASLAIVAQVLVARIRRAMGGADVADVY